MGQIKKNKELYYIDWGVFNTKAALLTHFRSLGQKSKNNFFQFLVQMRTRKFTFEIYQPNAVVIHYCAWYTFLRNRR